MSGRSTATGCSMAVAPRSDAAGGVCWTKPLTDATAVTMAMEVRATRLGTGTIIDVWMCSL